MQKQFKGLTSQEVLESRRTHGENVLTPPVRESWWKLYLEKYDDPVIRILLIAACIAFLVGLAHNEYVEAVGIVVAVFLATTMAFVNEYKAGREFDILNQVNDDVESMGVKVLEQFALLGQYDFLNILEAPDEVTMARVATMLASRGTLKTLTLPAIDVDAYIEAMRGLGS